MLQIRPEFLDEFQLLLELPHVLVSVWAGLHFDDESFLFNITSRRDVYSKESLFFLTQTIFRQLQVHTNGGNRTNGTIKNRVVSH